MSGITVSDELIALYESVKIRKTHKYILFSLQKADAAGKSYNWSIDVTADPVAATDADANKATFQALVAQFNPGAPAFAVFDFTETTSDGRQIGKLILIKWCPDDTHFRLKPVIGATYTSLKEKLTGLGKDVQASDRSDLEYEAIKKLVVS